MYLFHFPSFQPNTNDGNGLSFPYGRKIDHSTFPSFHFSILSTKHSLRDRDGRTVLVMRPGKQAAKVFLDPSTVQKMKFVYPNDGQSMEVMKKHFDVDMLPMELGGRMDVKYDHGEYSKAMRSDDIKMASFWASSVEKPNCENFKRPSAAATSPPESSSSLA